MSSGGLPIHPNASNLYTPIRSLFLATEGKQERFSPPDWPL